jgi:hypothetical protein
VDTIAGLDDVEKRKFVTLTEIEVRPIGRLARSQSLYRLRYPGTVRISNVIVRDFHLYYLIIR